MAEVIEAYVKGDIMRLHESKIIELKEIYTPDLKKEVVAFANIELVLKEDKNIIKQTVVNREIVFRQI